ncbi:MAG: peroxide stress protein YaaA [Flavobacteriales bacterium]|tara:strand:+ start:486 stop:1247 length:762 start_codon:yes stop_codon:yes gene_type:complete
MKMVISPAKSLQFDKQLPTTVQTQPHFGEEAKKINVLLKKKSPKELSELMSISDKLAQLNWERNQVFQTPESKITARAAVFAFNGDVYQGLDAYTFDKKKIDQMQNQLRILSGLYGLLKPLDIIKPHRLEMGTTFGVGNNKNLYSFWKDKITKQLNAEMEPDELFINLASNEYFSAIDVKELNVEIVSPIFKDFKNGKLKIISFFAKKARGMMARHLIKENASTLEDILSFSSGGYSYSEIESRDTLSPVFVR